ncbi:MAG: prolyl oligopeptidase family serine peptidase [Reyranella sp.]|jgi:dienelactone hydrolase|nr:prolyl oligopeptidase family serine peptidase [Reyranella sp.]
MTGSQRFRDREVVFGSGLRGETIDIPSASPLNYWQAISDPAAMPRVTVDGKLFLPESGRGRMPVVVIVPGSLSIAASHLRHAETLVDMGIAAFVLDPFGARGVTSTVANQAQFSFAASAYDVAAAVGVLARHPAIDPARIGLQGHSRGGSAVLTAATRLFCETVHDPALCVRAVLAAYPWCGHQFLDPDVGATEVRVVVGDQDDWVSPQQCQGYVQALRLWGGDASIRIVAGAEHSFDREEPVQHIAEASVSPAAPTGYIADDGAFVHPTEGMPNPALTDRDLAVYALKAGYGVRGATIGAQGDQPALFRAEMTGFFGRTLLS